MLFADRGFPTEEEMVEFLNFESGTSLASSLGGVVFLNFDPVQNATIPRNMTYKIRPKAEQYFGLGYSVRIYSASDWYTTFLFPFYQTLGPREEDEYDGGIPGKTASKIHSMNLLFVLRNS